MALLAFKYSFTKTTHKKAALKGRLFVIGAGNGMTSFTAALGIADRRTPVRLSVVVAPTSRGSKSLSAKTAYKKAALKDGFL